eukprot:gnl/TRDRNA2_/TRDRNA2_87762_c0_seq2.p1 gnl/TRDRNA2_/TRDRNA2_87762_c0~~gnl/TRDRNA2_/TRDRNA2_87762_c0_seq2.p1  ORF type:complete len:126 (+),score=44.49 gnl/TRDRNA2_/TRDRNA2_87762_c0_seq2:52-378(+)
MSEKAKAKIKALFDDADTNKNGYLNKEEFKGVMQCIEVALEIDYDDDECDTCFEESDKDGDGKISLEEVTKAMLDQQFTGDEGDGDEPPDEDEEEADGESPTKKAKKE